MLNDEISNVVIIAAENQNKSKKYVLINIVMEKRNEDLLLSWLSRGGLPQSYVEISNITVEQIPLIWCFLFDAVRLLCLINVLFRNFAMICVNCILFYKIYFHLNFDYIYLEAPICKSI